MTNVLLTAALLLASLSISAQQDTVYMDSTMKHVKKKTKATQYAIVQGTQNDRTQVDLYTIDGKLIRCSEYKTFGNNENKQVLEGLTTYKFDNSNQDSLKVFYRDNIKNGDATYYHENGNVKANCQYKNGQLDGMLHQLYDDGKTKRKEFYKNDVSEGGVYLSPDSTQMAYSPFYKNAQLNEIDIYTTISKQMRLSTELLQAMSKKNMNDAYAKVGIIVNNKGEVTDIIVTESNHQLINKKCFDNAIASLNEQTILPAELDGEPITSTYILNEPIKIVSTPASSTINIIK